VIDEISELVVWSCDSALALMRRRIPASASPCRLRHLRDTAGIVCLKLYLDEFVAIEIDEGNLSMQELIGETGFVNKEFCIAMMTWLFSHNNGCGGDRRKASAAAPMSRGVGVYRASGNVLDRTDAILYEDAMSSTTGLLLSRLEELDGFPSGSSIWICRPPGPTSI